MTLNRRTALLATFSMLLGTFKVARAEGANLRIDLSQWSGIDIEYRTRTIHFTPAEIFAALSEDTRPLKETR